MIYILSPTRTDENLGSASVSTTDHPPMLFVHCRMVGRSVRRPSSLLKHPQASDALQTPDSGPPATDDYAVHYTQPAEANVGR